ncbi:YggS family pyridoxal phosphate-dependent enzyme [Pusillimonas sp. ANT_WB101]|uniref:YggS family pyridoxal phosphate-dependent enzyme n=1 Tax=Pusillimonas sp. ANT_WB101 TaxID=2597356 RepID=UPI0011ECB470|nr:YggS family pyridoxal phosphate-dependent enzyme [Pusillimonas sp. ANT_WB101]KAA0910494.1 YggS family pyridoxal phosphate-dependent enzyme [Pusillimonas sp. ANT_WB101]NYT79349.1 YggS family pyridoxal phosphate-dependent enzyme [Alcaligenaceae bacterium]
MAHQDSISSRLAAIRQRIDDSAQRAGRAAGSVTLLPVSKTFGEAPIREAVAAGVRRLGENKAQEIRSKFEPLADCGIDWVMIGNLQTNKAKDIARMASEIQSLDRLDLAVALERRLQHEGRAIDALVQIKTSTEPTKYGLPPDELLPFLRQVARDMPTLRIRGLMTLAINLHDQDAVRACFRTLRVLRDRMREEAVDGVEMERLSMGMSGDFEIAIEEGSTEVRIGTAIFGGRIYNDDYYWPETETPPVK